MDNKQNRTKLCLRSISEDTSDQDIREFCEKYGEVKYFKRLENKYTAFVEYATVRYGHHFFFFLLLRIHVM